MAYGLHPDDAAWSRSGAIVAVLAAAAATAAWAAALRPVRFSTPALALGWLLAVGGVCVIARVRMPGPAKAVILAAVCGSLLTCFATQDVLSLRRVGGRAEAALAEPSLTAPALPSPSAAVSVTSDGSDTAGLAAQVADVARARLEKGDVGLSARVSRVGDPADGSYRLDWTLHRGEQRRWCGAVTTFPDAARSAFAGFGDRLGQAVARSRGHDLDCG